MTLVSAADEISADPAWKVRLREDRRRAASLQTRAQRRAVHMILQRSLALDAQAVALTGSTVRERRTAISDLDVMIVGQRPDLAGVGEDVDVYAAGTNAFWERLMAGDDYIQWTLRFGWILHDDGILRAASHHIAKHRISPSADRKLAQAYRGLRMARAVLESGDIDAAREQTLAALTTVARWLLIANRRFPLCRDELSEQLDALAHTDLAIALQRLIHDQPSNEELRSGVQLGERLIAEEDAAAPLATAPVRGRR
jgi:hypothetical protein